LLPCHSFLSNKHLYKPIDTGASDETHPPSTQATQMTQTANMSIKPDNDNIHSKDDMKLEFALVEDRDASAAEISRDHIEVTPEDVSTS
jgi:hypothetical protein